MGDATGREEPMDRGALGTGFEMSRRLASIAAFKSGSLSGPGSAESLTGLTVDGGWEGV